MWSGASRGAPQLALPFAASPCCICDVLAVPKLGMVLKDPGHVVSGFVEVRKRGMELLVGDANAAVDAVVAVRDPVTNALARRPRPGIQGSGTGSIR